jgi:hypothetical protein
MTADARLGAPSRVSVAIVWAATIVGHIHPTDHVLRVDHSGSRIGRTVESGGWVRVRRFGGYDTQATVSAT